jgi:NAD(P)-dependent dehydrogenase (short-subunit alcohol dehydrogenase family)
MDYGLKGKIAVITGGSDGIGKATAIALAREGAKVVICARGQEKLDQTAAQIRKEGGEVLAVKADVTSDADINRLFDDTLKQYGGVDLLLNNAGLSQRGKFLEIDDKMWQIDLDIKVYGAIRCLRRAIPEMRKRGGGRIVNITISSAKQPGAGSMPTSLSRAAGLVITKALSKEYAPENILVNTVCIGKIKSGQHDRRINNNKISAEKYYEENSKDIPMGRFGEAEEAANAIVFLMSAAASYVTGTSINLDGGVSGVL